MFDLAIFTDDISQNLDYALAVALGGHVDGSRIGFDLGGSDRKCAALIDGEVVHSEEVEWSPYFEVDPQYHFDGIAEFRQRTDFGVQVDTAFAKRVDRLGQWFDEISVGTWKEPIH